MVKGDNMKTMTVFGTRPEAIKMAPLVRKLRENKIQNIVTVTAQHREMLDQVLDIFGIVPDYDLNIMKKDQTIFDITSNVLTGMKSILEKEKPDIVFVHGDTTTTMAVSLACFYLKIKIAHVEAGLRTYNKYSPFPEEKNRHITGVLADIHLSPTNTSRDNLINENILPENIFVTGNTVIDALFESLKIIKENALECKFEEKIKSMTNPDIFKKDIILVTGHRRENFGDNFRNIFGSFKRLCQKHKGNLNFIYPVHLNPNVRDMAMDMLSDINNFFLIEPLDYLLFTFLMNRSYIIITDSGGIQEEAPALGKPVLVTRDTTERPEAVSAGTVVLVGSDCDTIEKSFLSIYENTDIYNKMASAINPYGIGNTCDKIVEIISKGLEG
jgi:UDP-N-acetylglucosamine 2-epimerase (non-hydrolysing)